MARLRKADAAPLLQRALFEAPAVAGLAAGGSGPAGQAGVEALIRLLGELEEGVAPEADQ